jgi:hypothetical protein
MFIDGCMNIFVLKPKLPKLYRYLLNEGKGFGANQN